jgi:HEAT repeat protein
MIGLRALAIIGGPDALAAVTSAVKSAEPPVQDEAVRILSNWPNNWPQDSEAGRTLLRLATSAKKMSHQVLGLRGYFQYIRGTKKLSNEQKVTRVVDLLSHIKRPEEKRLAIAVLAEAPSPGALELLTTFAEDSAVVEEAYSAMVQVAGQDVRGVSKDQRRGVLKMVVEKSRNSGIKRRARRALSGIQ